MRKQLPIFSKLLQTILKTFFRTFNSEIFDGQEFQQGPRLPHSAWDSCVVEFEPNVVFITGGYIESAPAYLLDVDSGEVTELPPDPLAGKWFPACGVVPSPNFGGTDIVVAGGNDADTVVIYNTELNAWRPGPRLPFSIEGVSAKPIFSSFLLVKLIVHIHLFFRVATFLGRIRLSLLVAVMMSMT